LSARFGRLAPASLVSKVVSGRAPARNPSGCAKRARVSPNGRAS
jgi:hypothetical protein